MSRREALDSARRTMVFSSQDWAMAPDFAWLYGLFVGWDDPCLAELQAKFKWSDSDVQRLRSYRNALVPAPAPKRAKRKERKK